MSLDGYVVIDEDYFDIGLTNAFSIIAIHTLQCFLPMLVYIYVHVEILGWLRLLLSYRFTNTTILPIHGQPLSWSHYILLWRKIRYGKWCSLWMLFAQVITSVYHLADATSTNHMLPSRRGWKWPVSFWQVETMKTYQMTNGYSKDQTCQCTYWSGSRDFSISYLAWDILIITTNHVPRT